MPLHAGVHRRADRGDRRQPGGLVARALPPCHRAAARRHPSDRGEGADAGGAVQPLQSAAGPGAAARLHRAGPPQHAVRDRGARRLAPRGRAGRRAQGAGPHGEADRARAAADGTERDRRARAARLPGRSSRRLGAHARRRGAAGGRRGGGGGRAAHRRAGARGAGGPVAPRGAARQRLPDQRHRRVEPGRHQEPRKDGVGLAGSHRPRARGAALMAIKGSLKEASLPDVLQLLALGKKTGCLSIADRSNFGYIYFDKGRISYASIVNRRDRLGDILVKHEKITQEQLDAAIHRQAKERTKKLGEILVMQNVLTQQELERYMRMQIEESVYYLFTWTQGTFNFEADVRPEQQDFLVNINPESLLLEGARRVDEWGLIEKKIPSFDLIFLVDRDRLAISDAKLTEIQERLLPLLDGSRDVNQVIEDSGLGEFEVGKALYGLVTAGFLHRAGRTASAEDVKMTDARVEEHRNLGIAFYKTGMLDEAAREFRRVAELRSGEPNAHFYIGLVALKQARWREAMDALRLAAEKGGGRPAVFHNLGFAYEQLGRLDEAEAAYGEAAARARTDAKVYLGWGVVALKRGDYGGAAGRLDRARELFGKAPPPAWFWARSLAAAGAGEFELAQDLADEGAEAYPSHAALQNNLAVLKELSGDLTGAEDLVRAARKSEPSLPQLSKNLGDLAYRGSRYDEAWEAYSRAIELAPDLGDDVYFKLGNIAYKRSSRELAAQLWRKALEINPKHELVKANLDTLSALS